MNVKPIVVGTDGSEESLRAVEWAAGEAILHAAPLRIVSAAPLPPVMTELQIRPDRDHVADFIRSERDLALDAAASRAARVAPGLVIVTDPVAGPPAQGVTASGSGAAMLVVGSPRGRGVHGADAGFGQPVRGGPRGLPGRGRPRSAAGRQRARRRRYGRSGGLRRPAHLRVR